MKLKQYDYYNVSWMPNQRFLDYCKVQGLNRSVGLEKPIHTDVRKQDLQVFQEWLEHTMHVTEIKIEPKHLSMAMLDDADKAGMVLDTLEEI
jgi:hypothetical protein